MENLKDSVGIDGEVWSKLCSKKFLIFAQMGKIPAYVPVDVL
jgi:hypothetical protein